MIKKDYIIGFLVLVIAALSALMINDNITLNSNKELVKTNINSVDNNDKESNNLKDPTVKYGDTVNSTKLEKKVVYSNPVLNETKTYKTEDEVVDYFVALDNEVDVLLAEPEKNHNKLEQLFIKGVDFIFYNEPINGITFNELTDEVKEFVVNLVNKIDTKIDKHIPGYKESIKTTTNKVYTTVKTKVSEWFENYKKDVKKVVGEDGYTTITDTIDTVKDNASDIAGKAKDKVVDIATKTKDKIKNWYENWR